jgi:hypothetical protein
MNERSDMDHVLSRWFEDGPSTMPDRVVDVVADRIALQRQRPVWRLPWRPIDMNSMIKMGTAIAAVLVLTIVGWNLLPGRSSGNGGMEVSPSPVTAASATATSAPRPSSSENPADLPRQTFGLPISYTLPAGWEVRGGSPDLLQFVGGPAESPLSVALTPIAIRVGSSDCASGHSGATRLDKIVASLRANPAFAVSNVMQTTVDGRRAVGMTVTLAPGWTHTCANSQGRPAAPFLSDPVGLFANLDAEEALRLVFVDIAGVSGSPQLAGGSMTLLIAIGATADSLDSHVAQALSIVRSIRFGT